MLPAADVNSVLIYAVNSGLLAGLDEFYAGLPEKECEGCNKCCDRAPEASFIEYLAVYRYLQNELTENHAEVVRRVVDFFFLELVDPGQRCPFNDEVEGCLIRPVRPLHCRLFGILSKEDYEETERKRVSRLEKIAEGFRAEYGIEIPAAVLAPRPFCEKKQGETEQHADVTDIDIRKMRLMSYDASIVAPERVFREMTYLSLPVYLAMTVLNPGIRGKRVEVMQAFLQGSRELLDKYAGRAASFRF